jgi:hypothetical protein
MRDPQVRSNTMDLHDIIQQLEFFRDIGIALDPPCG